MKNQVGTSVVELLVASGIMLAASAAVLTLVNRTVSQSPKWNDDADLHQRARVAAEVITRLLSAAGASVPNTGRTPVFPAIEPRRRSAFTPSSSAVTVRYVPEGGAWSTIAADLLPGDASVELAARAGCPANVAACGFETADDVAILDGAGGWHLLVVESVAPPTLSIADRIPGRTSPFRAGATLVELVETSLYFDRASGVLRQEGPGDGDFPLVDRVADLRFEFLAAGQAPLALSALIDGPLCGSGSLAYDCDVHRVRTVRATLRILSPRAGGPDLSVVVDVSPRNLQR